MVPKQPAKGIIIVDIKTNRMLSVGDTDITGSFEYPETFHVYVNILILRNDMIRKLCLLFLETKTDSHT